MGFNLLTSYTSRLSPFSGSCRILNSRYSVLFLDDKGIKQSAREKLNIPEEPKKPTTPFIKYMQQLRKVLVQENPKISLGDLSKRASQQWKNVDHSERIEFELQYQRDKQLYEENRNKYLNSLTKEQIAALEQEKLKLVELKHKKVLKQKAKDLDKPKKPLTSYILFSTTKLKERGNTPLVDWQKQVAGDWHSLDKSEKEKYINKAREEQLEYSKALQKWEEKMIKLGHVELVRTESLTSKPKSERKK